MSTARNPPQKTVSEVCLVTYLDSQSIYNRLMSKYEDHQIEYAFFIVHNQDPCEAHTHIYIRLSRSRDINQIVRWFRGVDDNGDLVNTFAEPVKSCSSDVKDYFLHKNEESKHHYAEVELVYIGDVNTVTDSKDCTYDIVTLILAGTPLIDIVKSFGKDFVYHYAHYRMLISDILDDEKHFSSH